MAKLKGQRLVSKEIDKRVIITPNKTIKKIEEGVNGLMSFGENNDYPQVMEKIINGSVTAKTSANVYSKFLAGEGFENEEINKIEIGLDSRGKTITLQSLLRQVANSISRNNGAYIHCNYNRDTKIVGTHLKHFKYCRFAKPDDKGYSAKILFYTNWEKDQAKGNFKPKDIKNFNVFNSKKNVIIEEIKTAGSIDDYKGQIYFLFTDNEYFYPLSNYDEVYLDCDTEAQIALFKNRQTRNGFFKKTVLRIQPRKTDAETEKMADNARRSLGVDGDGLWIIEDEPDENGEFSDSMGFKFDQIDSDIEDELFKEWPKQLANNIRKAAKNIPNLLIEIQDGIFSGQSGEAIRQATNFYNAITKDDRKEIEDAFEEIFSNFNNDILRSNKNWKIKPLNLISDELESKTGDEPKDINAEAQAALRGSVGGVQGILQIQEGVSTGKTDRSAAIEILKEIYGFSEEKAEALLGNPKKEDDGTTDIESTE
jgi:hypothetical protein